MGRQFAGLRMAPVRSRKELNMHDICGICGAPGVNMVLVEGNTIDICRHCGAVFVHELNLIVQLPMPLPYDNNLYAVSYGIAMLYKHLSQTAITWP